MSLEELAIIAAVAGGAMCVLCGFVAGWAARGWRDDYWEAKYLREARERVEQGRRASRDPR